MVNEHGTSEGESGDVVAGDGWQPRAVLFDLDGTLVDTFNLYLEAYRRALAPILGYAPDDQEIITRRPTSERAFLGDWVGFDRVNECHEEMCRHYSDLHESLVGGVYDGVPEMLEALHAARVPVGIVTGKGRAAWETTRAALSLGRFAAVVTDSDVPTPKPDPAGLRLALDTLEVAPAAAVYVGDSVGDVRAGRNAGTRTAAALWPKTGDGEPARFWEEIAPLEPDWIFEWPADVAEAFASGTA